MDGPLYISDDTCSYIFQMIPVRIFQMTPVRIFQMIPVRYHSTYTGTQEEQCCDLDVHIDYKEIEVPPTTDTDDWFQVPDFCP